MQQYIIKFKFEDSKSALEKYQEIVFQIKNRLKIWQQTNGSKPSSVQMKAGIETFELLNLSSLVSMTADDNKTLLKVYGICCELNNDWAIDYDLLVIDMN